MKQHLPNRLLNILFCRGANDEDDELGGSDDGSISMDDDMELDDEDEPGSGKKKASIFFTENEII